MKDYSKYSRNELIDIIEKLSYDPSFGILTRTGLELIMEDSYDCLFIDFDNVHYLNHSIGYDAVNKLIREILATMNYMQGIWIGRLFSGDEIVILTKVLDIRLIEEQLHIRSTEKGMTYSHEIFYGIKNLDVIK